MVKYKYLQQLGMKATKKPFRYMLLSVCHTYIPTEGISQHIWLRSRNCGCLVTWFCYQLIAKPDNKTAAVSWPAPYALVCKAKALIYVNNIYWQDKHILLILRVMWILQWNLTGWQIFYMHLLLILLLTNNSRDQIYNFQPAIKDDLHCNTNINLHTKDI